MGIEHSHPPVKLVMPTLYSDQLIYETILKNLIKIYGPIDYSYPPFEFQFTHYYDSEMGTPIYRVFIAFQNLIPPESLVAIKLNTNRLELKYAVANRRKVNLDPGILSLGKFILATTKNYSHRIYMGKGIYEEVTLYYSGGQWCPYEWTYPDYADKRYQLILQEIREIYKRQLSKLSKSP